MRFGVPASQDVAVLPRPRMNSTRTTNPRTSSNFNTGLSAGPSASQIISDSLMTLDALHILNQSRSLKERSEKWKSLVEKSNKLAKTKLSNLDEDFDRRIRALQLDVQTIIEKQLRLREEEKQRILKKETERQQKLKEEAQRKRLEEEEKQRLKNLAEEKKLAEQKRLAEEQRIKKEKEDFEKLEQKKAEILKAKAEKEAAAKRKSAFSNTDDIEKTLFKYRQDINDIKNNIVEAVDKDKELKKKIGAIKRKVNIRLGQLSNSLKQLDQISREIVSLVQQTTSHPLAYKWLLNFLLKGIVSQAETEVTVKPVAALPLGRLTYYLLCNLDGLDYFLSARFVKKCCLVIGYTGTIDTEEGRIRMGWRRSDGKWESEVKYEERMGGILSVWAVIGWVNQMPNFPLFNMKAEWMFLARLLNAKPDLLGDVHFVAVCNWWEASAEKFYKTYGKQAQKLLSLAATDWAALGASKSFPAATRLQILGEELFTKSKFNTLKEMEP